MYNEELGTRRFYVVNDIDDTPHIRRGSLIPNGRFLYTPRTYIEAVDDTITIRRFGATELMYAVAALLLIVTASFGSWRLISVHGPALMAAVAGSGADTPVIVENPYIHQITPLTYGIQVAMSQPDFFIDTHNAFIDANKTFIEVDLTTMQLRYFSHGVLREQLPIVSRGQPGSWSDTLAGLYQVKTKTSKYFSTLTHIYQPWNLSFQGNFSIHGPPYRPNNTLASSTVSGGIELSSNDAKTLYNLANIATPILVHEKVHQPDGFTYEPKVPELQTPHYLLADIESNTVLAGSDLNDSVPIASLTKLMTALIAADYISLDQNVTLTQQSFVQSLIPRLHGMNTVSMYSLMQLLLVESSNEAADVIADQIGRAKFISYMNEKAASLGMTKTTFTDPSGLDDGNVSSVLDLMRLVQYIYNNHRFIIDLTASKALPNAYINGQFGILDNFNQVKDLTNFIGGKVGETRAAGQTSITLHTITVKGQKRVVAIILLGSTQRNIDVKELLSYAQTRFSD